jgi:hypothetical protein
VTLLHTLSFTLSKRAANDFERAAVIEAHHSWCGPCECVRPILYRVSLDKEDIKFCTAAIDKVEEKKDTAHENSMCTLWWLYVCYAMASPWDPYVPHVFRLTRKNTGKPFLLLCTCPDLCTYYYAHASFMVIV